MITWRQKEEAPEWITSGDGVTASNGNTIYFSQSNWVYSYTAPADKWIKLPPCKHSYFGLAVVNHVLTAIGGLQSGWIGSVKYTNVLLSFSGRTWNKVFPPMQTRRSHPAAATTPTHLVVAGGAVDEHPCTAVVEVLNIDTVQWSIASNLPKAAYKSQMILCDGSFYLSSDNTVFSCSVEDLESCKPKPTNSIDGGSVWTRLADIPKGYYKSSVTTLRGRVLVIGGSEYEAGKAKSPGTIHCYDVANNLWSAIGELPTPRSEVLAAALLNNDLIVLGGKTCEICTGL